MQIALTALHQQDKHGHPITYLNGLPAHDAAITPEEMRRLARQLNTAANDAQQGMRGEATYPEE